MICLRVSLLFGKAPAADGGGERMRWIDRELLFAIYGRSIRPQTSLAKSVGLRDYPRPANGCLLTFKEYSIKLRDFLAMSPDSFTTRDAIFLSIGRHFRINGDKLIIGRFKEENLRLRTLSTGCDLVIEPMSVPGPTALFQSERQELFRAAASFIVKYSDLNGRKF